MKPFIISRVDSSIDKGRSRILASRYTVVMVIMVSYLIKKISDASVPSNRSPKKANRHYYVKLI